MDIEVIHKNDGKMQLSFSFLRGAVYVDFPDGSVQVAVREFDSSDSEARIMTAAALVDAARKLDANYVNGINF